MLGKRTCLVALLAACSLMGCATGQPLIDPPGTTAFQQFRASLHDPYADNDAGPQVIGGRPREFNAPRDEPVRTRWFRDSWWSF